MPCNFRYELIAAINSNPQLKAMYQRYVTITSNIILKMIASNHKFNSQAYLNESLTLSKSLITEFSTAEKLLLAAIEFDNNQLQSILFDCPDINQILALPLDKRYLAIDNRHEV